MIDFFQFTENDVRFTHLTTGYCQLPTDW